MANFAVVMKEEVFRLARKEIRIAILPLQETITALRKKVSEQKKSIVALEKKISKIDKKLGMSASSTTLPTLEEVAKTNLTPHQIERMRKKAGLSRDKMAQVLDVNSNSIYLWEQGKANPRAATKAKLIKFRSLGKREIKKLLEEKAID